MAHYLITYDLRKVRDYPELYKALEYWKAARLLESVWLAELVGPAIEIRRILVQHIDGDDGLAVIELGPLIEWATIRCQAPGIEWLKARIPTHD